MDAHHSSAQFASIVLHPRADLEFSVRDYGSTPVYILEDARNGSIFRIGRGEYTFFSLLDGRKTIADTLGHCASLLKEEAFSEAEAAAFSRWLVENELASTVDSASSGRLCETSVARSERQSKSRLNPLSQKTPFGSPDGLMELLASFLGGAFSWLGLLCWLIFVVVGGGFAVLNSDVLFQQTVRIADASNWLWFVLTTIVLKIVHECAHGIACRREGIPVREWGVMWILFVPLPYLDVTASTRLPSRFRRLLIAAAGMMAELAVAAAAVLIWHGSSDPLVRQHALNVVIAAGLVTVLFNANPLMRFDGYYMLTDLLEMPNLAGHGQAWLQQAIRKIFFGQAAQHQDWPEGRHWIVCFYGISAFFWRLGVSFGLILAADAMYFGAGVVVAVISGALVFFVPVVRFVRFLVHGNGSVPPNRKRFLLVSGLLVLTCLGIGQLNWTADLIAPAVVGYDPVTVIRPKSAGFVTEVKVREGQAVEAGDILLVLQNEELRVDYRQTNEQLRADRTQARILFEQEDLAAWDGLQGKIGATAERLESLADQVDSLQVRSPVKGVVLTTAVDELPGRFLQPGQAVLEIADPDQKKILAMVRQADVDGFVAHQSQLRLHFWGDQKFERSGWLQKLEPRATTTVVHPALTSVAGGPLAVRMPQASEANGDASSEPELIEPRIIARIDLRDHDSALQTGRTGVVAISTTTGTVAEVLGQKCVSWYLKRQAALSRQWRL